jgi:shikimate dehydrogenase
MTASSPGELRHSARQPRSDACLGFVGVSTGSSSIMRVYPRWAELLGLPARQLAGYDLPIDSPAAAYRQVVAEIRDDPGQAGALVTTHKIAVYEAAGGMFDVLDGYARRFGEISCISKRDGALIGHAKDPISAALSLGEFLAADHFSRTGGEVICFGTGGAGCAITYCLAQRADRPSRIICTDTLASRLDHARQVHQAGGFPPDLFRYVLAESGSRHEELMRGLPEASLVVNATGMGKDRPGSPVPEGCPFPDGAVAWDLNYRGALEFVQQATRQQASRSLTVVDGWRYFIHGWTQVIAEVFGLSLDPATTDLLAEAAAEVR